LTNAGGALCSTNVPEGVTQLVAAIGEARRRNEPDFLPRLYSNLVYMMMSARHYEGLFERIQEGIDASVARDNSPLDAYMRGTRALALLDLGRTKEAIVEAEFVIYGPYPRGVIRFTAQIALARARIRLGLPDDGTLDEARALPTAKRDIMRLAPIAIVDAEACWLGIPRSGAREALRTAYQIALPAQGQKWTLAEIALWLGLLGEDVNLSPEEISRFPPAYRNHIAGRWREAADEWCELGCPYEQAIALSMGDEPAQREALSLFDRLGATPAAQKLRRAMRERGIRAIPSGPRSARRNDPAGLTPRQNQVLKLLAEGLSNSQIAARLQMSPKTVEHHVGAVLAAFEAPSRLRAVQIARERGVLGGTGPN
jgi:DNA-binding CsgD family transcriptional regulator